MTRILITDDEKDIVNALEIYLKPEGYEIQKAYTGKEAVDAVRQGNIDLVLLDVMMPVMDGLQAMSRIRSFSNVPIILLTAKSEDTDKVLGLNIGADDYITKPFNPAEVIARVRSQLRRYISLGGSQRQGEHVLVNGGLVLNEDAKSLTVDGTAVNLTPIEFGILELLMQNPGQVFSPREIYSRIWNDLPLGSENTVAVHIRHLREKLEINPAEPRYLKVVWGQGYKCEKQG